jgi:putative ABC transport system permease protein
VFRRPAAWGPGSCSASCRRCKLANGPERLAEGQYGAVRRRLRHNKARSILVVEVALALLLLLVGSALLIRTLVALRNVNPGFDPGSVLTMRISLTGPKYLQTAGVDQLLRDGVERLQSIPGVKRAAATCCVPLEGGYGLPFRILGRPLPDKAPFHGGGSWLTVSSGYFDVFKIPIKRGRAFTDRDDSLAPRWSSSTRPRAA